MRVVIVTDIFGCSAAISALRQDLNRDTPEYDIKPQRNLAKDQTPTTDRSTVEVIDPYAGQYRHFSTEQNAYQAFTRECGYDNYVVMVEQALSASTAATLVIGFSAGAAAAWQALDNQPNTPVKHLIGFYPGQIRHHLDARVHCPVTLVFPQHEPHFAIDPVMDQLTTHQNVTCIRTTLQHGFMNPLSTQYSAQSANEFHRQINHIDSLQDIQALRHAFNTVARPAAQRTTPTA